MVKTFSQHSIIPQFSFHSQCRRATTFGHFATLRNMANTFFGKVDVQWKDGKLTQAVIRAVSNIQDQRSVVFGKRTKTFQLAKGDSIALNATLDSVK
ncbi:hypothetical protein ES703_38254 [subsurface metagenome]